MLLSNPYLPDDRVRNEALALRDAGYEVTILAWDRDCTRPEQEKVEGLEIRRARIHAGYQQGAKQGLRFLRLWQWFADEIKQVQPHVVHCHDFDTFPAGVWYHFLNRRVRLVLDAHENYYAMQKPHVPAPVAWTILAVERLLTPFAQLLIGACESTANHYRECGARNAVVVGNWKDPEAFRFSAETLQQERETLGIGDRLVVAYIGLISARRQVLPLVEALRERPAFFLILGGKGDQADAVREVCTTAENIYFPGYIDPHRVPLLTAVADIVYYGHDPAHAYAAYNAPNKLYEALAAGKALIATDIGGELSHVIRSTQCGLLLPEAGVSTIGAALDTLADGTLLAELQERAAQAGLTTYNWAVGRQKLQSAYASLLQATDGKTGSVLEA